MPRPRGRRPAKERVPPTDAHVKSLIESIRARFEERGDPCWGAMPDTPAALAEWLVEHYEHPTHAVAKEKAAAREQTVADLRDARVLQEYCATTLRWRLYGAGRAAGLYWHEFSDHQGPLDPSGTRTGYWTSGDEVHRTAFTRLDAVLGSGRSAALSPAERRRRTRRVAHLTDEVTEQILGAALGLLARPVRAAIEKAAAGTFAHEELGEDFAELEIHARPPEGIEVSRTWLAVRLRCLLTTVRSAEAELRGEGRTAEEVANLLGREAASALASARHVMASYAESVD